MRTYFINYEFIDGPEDQDFEFQAPNDNVAKSMHRRWIAQFDESLFGFPPMLFTDEGENITDYPAYEEI